MALSRRDQHAVDRHAPDDAAEQQPGHERRDDQPDAGERQTFVRRGYSEKSVELLALVLGVGGQVVKRVVEQEMLFPFAPFPEGSRHDRVRPTFATALKHGTRRWATADARAGTVPAQTEFNPTNDQIPNERIIKRLTKCRRLPDRPDLANRRSIIAPIAGLRRHSTGDCGARDRSLRLQPGQHLSEIVLFEQRVATGVPGFRNDGCRTILTN